MYEGDLYDIANLLEEKGYGDSNMVILLEVDSEEELNYISDTYFYKTYGKEFTPPTIKDYFDVNIGTSIRFRYAVKKKN